MIFVRSWIIPSRSLSTFFYPMAMIITCKAITREGRFMTYKFVLPCMGRSYRFGNFMSTSLGMDPRIFTFYSSSIWSLLLPHLPSLVDGSISLSSTGRRSYLLSSHILAFDEVVFSQLPFSFGIFLVPPSCRTGLHSCLQVFTSCG